VKLLEVKMMNIALCKAESSVLALLCAVVPAGMAGLIIFWFAKITEFWHS